MININKKIECEKGLLYIEPEEDSKGYFYSICLNPEKRGLITNADICKDSRCRYITKRYIKYI